MGDLQDNKCEKVKGIFKPQNEVFATIKDISICSWIYLDVTLSFKKALIIHNVK